MKRRTLLASLGGTATGALAGCLANDTVDSPDTPAPKRVVEEWWDAGTEGDVERLRDLYHADSPEREKTYWNDEDWWAEFFEETTVEYRDLVVKTDAEAAVLDVFAESQHDQTGGYIHKLRPDSGDWRLWTVEPGKFKFNCPDDDPGERPAYSLPDECPTSTLADYDPPEELTCEMVEAFVEVYHETYVLNEIVSPTHERDSYAGSVTSIDRHEYGYVVTVDWEAVDYDEEEHWLKARPAAHLSEDQLERDEIDLNESDLPSVETIDREILRELAIEAAEQNESVEDSDSSEWDLDPMKAELESLPGTLSTATGGYVSVDGTPVRLRFDSLQMHNHYVGPTRYYVDPHVVRQSDENDEDTDPRQFPLLECQP